MADPQSLPEAATLRRHRVMARANNSREASDAQGFSSNFVRRGGPCESSTNPLMPLSIVNGGGFAVPLIAP
jgi:hypothetical protein